MPTLGLTPSFRSAVAKLDGSAHAAVFDALLKVQDGLESTHVHKLEGVDFVAFGVNRNALRVIALRDGDTLVCVHVDAHDDAYAWAKRHRAVRIGEVVRFVAVREEEDATAPVAGTKGPLADVHNRTFARFGIGAHAAAALRRLAGDDEVVELAEILDPAVGQALVGLATDPDDLPTLLRQFEQARDNGVAAASLAAAAASAANASTIWLPTSLQSLKAALEGGMADWRVFLHPSQERLVRMRARGAVSVTGGPGTGKTVVALHRARFLAERALADDRRPVLLTTFGRTLTEGLEDMVAQLCDDDAALIDRLEVRSLVAVAQHVLERAGRPHALLVAGDVDECWAEALAEEPLGVARRFYEGERELVCAAGDAWTEEAYLAAKRVGRGQRLDRAEKRKVWRVLAAFDAALARRGGGDATALARDAAHVGERPWSAVVCDEVQDASATELRLLAALARDPDTGAIRPDALFLCGDGYQRVYRSPVSLAACGIEVRGRSRRLRLNYRTTEGIRRAAIEVVKGLSLDDLETLGDDEATPFDGYRSLRGGPAPERRTFASEAEESAWIASLGDPLLVLARTKAYRDALAARLRGSGVEVHVLDGRGAVAERGVTVCTLHRSKGLEAPRVVVAGVQLVPARFPGGDEGERRGWERQEKCLVYVGMTRARDWCGVCGVAVGHDIG